jgi:hypothetical protein
MFGGLDHARPMPLQEVHTGARALPSQIMSDSMAPCAGAPAHVWHLHYIHYLRGCEDGDVLVTCAK